MKFDGFAANAVTRPPERRFTIGPELRAMIDSHIAEHGVTVCPPGAFSKAACDPRGYHPSVTVTDDLGRRVTVSGHRRGRRETALFRLRIVRLADGTRSVTEIAEALGVERAALGNHIAALRKQGHLCPVLGMKP